MCFNGKPYYCWVDFDRFTNHTRKIYDMKWKFQEFTSGYENHIEDASCPKNFEEMKKIVEKLSEGFDHVRIDLYEIGDKVYFGEMTFTSGGGYEIIKPDTYDFELGKLWDKFDYKMRDKYNMNDRI